MSLNMNVEKMKELLHDFYILTDIRVVIFDDKHIEILSFPETHSDFCKIMMDNDKTKSQCYKSFLKSIQVCKKTGELVISHCHAGLIEVTAPLKDNDNIIGYVVFGQITDIQDNKKLLLETVKRFQALGVDILWETAIQEVKYRNISQIMAISQIINACIYSVMLKELVSHDNERLINEMNEYINANLHTEITSQILCKELQINRNRLYKIIEQEFGIGIAKYIKKQKRNRADFCLTDTNMNLTEGWINK